MDRDPLEPGFDINMSSGIHQVRRHTVEGEAVEVLTKSGQVIGVTLRDKTRIYSNSVILTCGTFLSGLVHIGQKKIRAGRMGEAGAEGLTESLVSLGFKSARLKTGTPPRLDKNTIDWEKTKVVYGDKRPLPFSYRTKNFSPPSVPCHTIQTNKKCKKTIKSSNWCFLFEYSGILPHNGYRRLRDNWFS